MPKVINVLLKGSGFALARDCWSGMMCVHRSVCLYCMQFSTVVWQFRCMQLSLFVCRTNSQC